MDMIFLIRFLLIKLRIIERPDLILKVMTEQPANKDLKLGELVIVGKKLSPKWAVLKCPGRCGHIMRLPLMSRASPRWAIQSDWLRRPTASPSVHQKNACRAHYWIKKGKVIWCKDSGCGST